MAVESTLLFGNAPSEEVLRVQIGESRKAGRGKMEVPIKVFFPLRELTFLPAGDGLATSIELRIAVLDDSGGRSEVPVIPIALEIEESPGEDEFGSYDTALKMRRQPHRAVMAVHDTASGRILSATVQISP